MATPRTTSRLKGGAPSISRHSQRENTGCPGLEDFDEGGEACNDDTDRNCDDWNPMYNPGYSCSGVEDVSQELHQRRVVLA